MPDRERAPNHGGDRTPVRLGPVPTSTPAGIAAACTAVTAWGLGNTLIASIPMSGLAVAFYRLAVAIVVYVPILYVRGGRLSVRSFRLGWMGGVAFGANIATFFVALRMTSVANATTIAALQPLVIAGFATVMFGERIRARHIASALVATGGVAMVAFGATGNSDASLSGDLLALLALFTWAWYFIASKRARTGLDTFEYMTVMNVVAFAVVAPLAVVGGQLQGSENALTPGRLAAIAMVVCIPGSGHILMNWAHEHTTLMLTSLATLAIPVLATISAAIFLDQPVVGVQVVGIAIVLVALGAVIAGDARDVPEILDATEPST